MVHAAVCQVLFRAVLPVVLLLAVLFRYNIFSFVYLLLLLVNPLVPGPTYRNSNSVRSNYYLKTIVGASTLFCVAQVVYQIVLLSTQSYSRDHSPEESCSLRERLLALTGLHRADGIKAPDALRLLGLDFVVLFVGTFSLVVCEKLATPEDTPRSSSGGAVGGGMRRRRHTILLLLGEGLVLVLMAASGILYASLTSLAYFVCFLWSATTLGMHRPLGTFYRVMRTLLLIYSAVHLMALYVYQLDYLQELVPPSSLQARLAGLPSLRIPACNSTLAPTVDVRVLQFRSSHWTLYVSPLVLLCFYFTVATVTRLQLLQQGSRASPQIVTGPGGTVLRLDSKRSSQRSAVSFSRKHRKESGSGVDEDAVQKAPLLDNDHVGRSYQSMAASAEPSASGVWPSVEATTAGGAAASSVGATSCGGAAEEDTVAAGGSSQQPERAGGAGRQLALLLVVQAFRLLTRGSYVVTLIIMMAWSITYHSWLTFLLLLWSCVLWMMPSSRLACLRSSPALVAYAELLLLLQYVYSLDLTDEELPPQVNAVNLAQVGLFKYGHDSYQPLAVKTLYTIMFWITLRQYVEHQRTPPSGGIAELRRQMSMGAASLGPGTQLYGRRLGNLVQQWLTRYWIWVVAIMLMVISLGGTEVVLYRIAYMLLFLFFILVFQASYQLWIKVMYGFWLTVIIYSMLVLILIYTYQFEKFPYYWATYLHIPNEIQKDIGLEVYQSDPGTLFLKLLTPTFFLIITIIQLHYFHQEFIKLNEDNYSAPNLNEMAPATAAEARQPSPTQPEDVAIAVEAPPATPVRRHSEGEESDEVATPATVVPSTKAQQPGDTSPKSGGGTAWLSLERVINVLSKAADVCWRLLEIHMMKAVLLAVFMLAIFDVCAVHIVFVVLVVVALPFRWMQLFLTHCCSMWASMLLLAKMIYQLNFVDRYGWSTNCTSVSGFEGNSSDFPPPFNSTIDNRIWIGFQKTSNLTSYCKGYIMLIVVFSAHAMVRYRQRFYRVRHQLPEPRPGVVFTQANRSNADVGIKQCLMYLLNYFFYKFGVEVCFVTMVTCIGVRLDVFALMTSLWLCAMFLLRRRNLAKVWPFYVAYLCFVLPLQYLVVVGLPPGLCIEYPWSDPHNKVIRETALWLFLPDFQDPPLAKKILVDFVQLLFACCQLHVFFLESSHSAVTYEGGSNREIYDKSGRYIGQTPNPISDFVTYSRSYLSMVKVFLFFSFYWITLAVMFLAGTNRVSLFAMGYVLGCFFFLWNGNEFYLKPMNVLLKMWNTLLAYNVVVIFIKCILQVVGCVFLDKLSKYSCWMVQLFGIACLKRLQNEPLPGGSNPSSLPSSGGGVCRVPLDEAGLLWDGICLAFLLMQKRLFTSYYFHHLIIEILAQQQLASRGAEMIHEIQMKDVQEQRAAERDIMEKIKRKMDKIRANQHKVRAGEYVEPETHFQAIRSGDYYLFDDFAGMDIELDLDVKTRKSAEDEDADVKVRGINALLSNAMKSGTIKCTSEDARLVSEEADDVNESSRLSPIVSMDRSPLSRTVSGTSQPSKSSSKPVPSASDQPSTSAEEGLLPEDPHPGTSEAAAGTPATSTGAAAAAAAASAPAPSTTVSTASAGLTPKSTRRGEAGQVVCEGADATHSVRPPTDETYGERLRSLLAFGLALLDSMLISATAKLNSVSRDYRYVARKLADEKRIVKAQFVTGIATTLGEPSLRSRKFHHHEHQTDNRHTPVAGKKGSDEKLFSESVEVGDSVDKPDGRQSHPSVVRFVIACYYAIVSRSEVVCYLVIVLNQMKSASLLSLPLPLMAFLWGSLSVPRPTKTFWITIITYTEAIVVVKYLFQFDFFDWNDSVPVNRPFDPPRILGIEKRKEDNDYALYDLLLLLLVFFHRFMLKSLGLWKDTDRSVSVSAVQQPELATHDDNFPPPTRKPSEHSVKALVAAPVEQPPGTSATLERSVVPVDTASSGSRCYDDVAPGRSGIDETFMHFSKIGDGISHYIEPFRNFFENLLHPVYRVTTDVYAYMFFCDFINFFIMVFGYWAFGTGGSEDGVASYFQKNEVPVPFLIMLLAQFALIVIDRALYLRKYILGKLIFQVFIVFVIHIWMFFVLPGISQRSFVEEKNLPPKLWYFIKCIYLILSAYQIRSGYPTRILGNFFCKKYNYINYFLFKGYMLIPFLYELRSLMDWIWTDTSMNLTNWLKMEDIFANVFLLKCQRRAEEEYPTPRGSRRSSLTKYGLGGVMLFAIILVIWFPLLLFSLGNTVGQTLLPHDCTVELSLGGYEPIFKISAQQGNLRPLPYDSWVRLQAEYKSNAAAQAFLANYDAADVAVVTLNGNSTAVWTVSPPSQEALIAELNRTAVPLRLSWAFSRSVDSESSNAERVVSNEKTVALQDEHVRTSLADMLRGRPNNVTVPPILPRFLLVPRKGKSDVIRALDAPGMGPFRNLTLRLRTGAFNNLSARSEWWEVQEHCTDAYPYPFLRDDQGSCTDLNLVVFNDKVFPQALSQLTGYGIAGLYTTFVLVVSRLIRGFMAGSAFSIMFDDMPNVDRVLQLCLDIYLVRESRELSLEEDLFAKLIFLYRSPETLIKWTRAADQQPLA